MAEEIKRVPGRALGVNAGGRGCSVQGGARPWPAALPGEESGTPALDGSFPPKPQLGQCLAGERYLTRCS